MGKLKLFHVGNIWIGPWANFPLYMDPTFGVGMDVDDPFNFERDRGLTLLPSLISLSVYTMNSY